MNNELGKLTVTTECRDCGEYEGIRIFTVHGIYTNIFTGNKEEWYECRLFKGDKFLFRDSCSIDGSKEFKGWNQAYNDAKLNIDSLRRIKNNFLFSLLIISLHNGK